MNKRKFLILLDVRYDNIFLKFLSFLNRSHPLILKEKKLDQTGVSHLGSPQPTSSVSPLPARVHNQIDNRQLGVQVVFAEQVFFWLESIIRLYPDLSLFSKIAFQPFVLEVAFTAGREVDIMLDKFRR